MPQPLASVRTTTNIDVCFDLYKERPELAAKAMTVISIWSVIDHMMVRLTSQCLKADYLVVTSMLNELKSSHNTLELVKKAVETVYPEYWPLFQVVCKIIKPSKDRRNEFAHYLWYTTPEIPNGICLVDPRYASKIRAEEIQFIRDNPDFDATEGDWNQVPDLDRSKIMVFREKDLDYEIQMANNAETLVTRMVNAIGDHPVNVEMLRLLLSDPRVQSALQRQSKQKYEDAGHI